MTTFATRVVPYVATTEGFDRAEAAIGRTDDALDDAAASAGKAGSTMGQTGAKAAAMGDDLKKAGNDAKVAGGGLEAFEKRVGFANKIVTGFGLLALPGAITGLLGMTQSLFAATDAGADFTRTQEAQAAAIDNTVAKLTAMQALITRVSAKDIVGYTRATQQAAIIQGELTEAIGEQIKAEDALRRAERRGESLRSYLKDVSAANREVAELQAAFEKVDTVVRDFDDRRVFESSDDLQKRLAEDAAKAAKGVRAVKAEVVELVSAYDRLYDMLEPGNRAAIEGAARRAEAEEQANANVVESSRLSWEGLADQRRQFYDDAERDIQTFADKVAAITGKVGGPIAGVIDSIAVALGSKGPQAWAAWADAAQEAIGIISGALGGLRAGMEAVAEAELIGLRNAVISAEQQRDSAKSAEERAAAEQAVYRAQVELAEAEEEAAASRQRWTALEMGIKGVEAAADSIKAGALALLLASNPFTAALAPIAAASAVAYGLAAAAYGAGAIATATAPTPKSARPTPPGALGEVERDRTTGAGGGGGGGGQSITNNNFNFGGALLNTERDFQRLVRGALKDSENATGLPRPNFGKIGGV